MISRRNDEPLGYCNGQFSVAFAIGELIGLACDIAPYAIVGYVIAHFVGKYW